MDTKSLLENFKVDLTCVLCLGYLTDPVVVKCGHNFCKECLLSCWKEVHTPINCPCCSEIIEFGDFLNNKRLQNLTINSRMLGSLLLQSILDLTICDTHRKEEIMFCEKDHRSLCGCCFLSTEHKEHKVLPLEKAALQCMKLQQKWYILKQKKQQFQMKLEFEQKRMTQWEKEWLQSQRLDTEARDTLNVEENKDNLTQEMIKCSGNSEKHPVEMFKLEDQAMRESFETEFEKKCPFLSEEKKLHLQILDLDIKDNSTKFEECKAKMIQQIHKLQTVMSEIEKNFEKLPIEMLQDMKVILERTEDLLVQNPVTASPMWTLKPIPGMTEMLLTFHRDLTLDPETANPHLLLSEDLKSVEYVSVPQDVSDNPERFDFILCVWLPRALSQGNTTGK